METENTCALWPQNVLITPPVCTSQSFAVSSSLPDTNNIPSGEKVEHLTQSMCPEKIAVWLPVTASRIVISPECKQTATLLFQHETDSGRPLRDTVQEQFSHSGGAPVTTLTAFESSALEYFWSHDEEGENGRA